MRCWGCGGGGRARDAPSFRGRTGALPVPSWCSGPEALSSCRCTRPGTAGDAWAAAACWPCASAGPRECGREGMRALSFSSSRPSSRAAATPALASAPPPLSSPHAGSSSLSADSRRCTPGMRPSASSRRSAKRDIDPHMQRGRAVVVCAERPGLPRAGRRRLRRPAQGPRGRLAHAASLQSMCGREGGRKGTARAREAPPRAACGARAPRALGAVTARRKKRRFESNHMKGFLF